MSVDEMESPVLTKNGIPIACSNCCDLFPTTRTDSDDCDSNQGFESHPVYDLTQEEQVLAISSVLEKIYRYEQLRDLNDYEEGLVENVPLCQKCANILNQMDILHQEFDRLRRLKSYISRKINRVDEIIRDRIVDLNLRLVTGGDNTRVAEDAQGVVKTEPEEPPKILHPSGPWVVLKRLRPAEIPETLEVTPEELLRVDPLEDDNFPEVNFEPAYKEEDLSFDIDDDDTASCSYKKIRRSKRNVNRLAAQFTQLAKNKDITAAQMNVTKSRSLKKSLRTGDKEPKGIKKGRIKKLEKPRNPSRLVDFYRRKQFHSYPCYYCQEGFEIESDRVEHLKREHCTEHRCIICPPCGKLFGTEHGKKLHDPKCGVVPSRYMMPPYICNDCGKEFKSRYILESHEKYVHSTERPFACDQCEHTAKNAGALSLHQKFVHTDSDKVECPECHKILKSQPCFEDHYKNMHTPEGYRKYKLLSKKILARVNEKNRQKRITTSVCLECNIDFQTVARYKTHRNKVHTTAKKWQCEQCGKGFNNAWVFRKHQEFVHTDARPFICDQCGLSFKSPSNLQTHVSRAHTEEGRLKYNEYNKVNYRRKQRLAQELLKMREVEVPNDQGKEVPQSSGTFSVNNEREVD